MAAAPRSSGGRDRTGASIVGRPSTGRPRRPIRMPSTVASRPSANPTLAYEIMSYLLERRYGILILSGITRER
jgi:hypothetical protein